MSSIAIVFGNLANNKTSVEVQRPDTQHPVSLADVAYSASQNRLKPMFVNLPDWPEALSVRFFGRGKPFEVRLNRKSSVSAKLYLDGEEVTAVRCCYTGKKEVTSFFAAEATGLATSAEQTAHEPESYADKHFQAQPERLRPIPRVSTPQQRNGHPHSVKEKPVPQKSASPTREPLTVSLLLNEKRVPMLKKDTFQMGIGDRLRAARSAGEVIKFPIVEGIFLEIFWLTEFSYFVRLASPDRLEVNGAVVDGAYLEVNAAWRVKSLREASKAEFTAASHPQ